MRLLIITQKVDEKDDVLGFFINWIRAIAQQVEQVNVICLAKGTFNLPENVEVVSLGKEKHYPKVLQAVLFYIHAFRYIIRSDGVFIHMAPEYVKALYPLNFFFRRPIVMWYAHIKVSQTAKWAIEHVNYVVTPSKESFEFDSSKVVSTGHGINTELFSPKKVPIEADLVSMSRISKVKRIETLIEAMNILVNERHIMVTADIYGKPARAEDTAYMVELRKLTDTYGLGHCVRWKGAVANDHAPDVYSAHRIFVRMQGGGGFGKTELEAMSVGLPAIVPTQVYKSELGGFAADLYFPEDDAVALADRIEGVLSWDETRRESYSVAARALVAKKHNIQTVARRIVELLKQA